MDLELHTDLQRLRDVFGSDPVGSSCPRVARDDDGNARWNLAISTLCGNLPQPGREAGYRLRTKVGLRGARVQLPSGDVKRKRRQAAEALIRKLDEAAHVIALHLGHVDKRVRALLRGPEAVGEDGAVLPVVDEYSSGEDADPVYGPAPPPAARPTGATEEADRPPGWTDAPPIASSAGSLSAEARSQAATLERARKLACAKRRLASQMGRVALERWRRRGHRAAPREPPTTPPRPPSPPAPHGADDGDEAVDERGFLCPLRAPDAGSPRSGAGDT